MQTCWMDSLGDILESQGINPGNIFEAIPQEIYLGTRRFDGIMVVTNKEPGKVPRSILDIETVYAYINGNTFTIPRIDLADRFKDLDFC